MKLELIIDRFCFGNHFSLVGIFPGETSCGENRRHKDRQRKRKRIGTTNGPGMDSRIGNYYIIGFILANN